MIFLQESKILYPKLYQKLPNLNYIRKRVRRRHSFFQILKKSNFSILKLSPKCKFQSGRRTAMGGRRTRSYFKGGGRRTAFKFLIFPHFSGMDGWRTGVPRNDINWQSDRGNYFYCQYTGNRTDYWNYLFWIPYQFLKIQAFQTFPFQ